MNDSQNIQEKLSCLPELMAWWQSVKRYMGRNGYSTVLALIMAELFAFEDTRSLPTSC